MAVNGEKKGSFFDRPELYEFLNMRGAEAWEIAATISGDTSYFGKIILQRETCGINIELR